MIIGFHVNKDSREKYSFEEKLYHPIGTVFFNDFSNCIRFTEKLNKDKKKQEKYFSANIYALSLLHKIYHKIFESYIESVDKDLNQKLVNFSKQEIHPQEYKKILTLFNQEFPPLAIHQNKIDVKKYLDKKSNQEISLQECILLNITNMNPACKKYDELYSNKKLIEETEYDILNKKLESFFNQLPSFSDDKNLDKKLSLIDMLLEPAKRHPNSLSDQLRFMALHWKDFLGDLYLDILRGIDYIKEEEKMFINFSGHGEVKPYDFSDLDNVERYSQDYDWMPNVILLAKSTLVWLDQLSKKYKREIKTLDQIPNEELDIMASRGVTGLWLIGLWQRSGASKKIKQLCGNPEAESSAYSLFGYIIAEELGGYSAVRNLKSRCLDRGIRLASDMVPNHTGIDSDWMINHPHRFISLDEPPYPSYTFNGENLSNDPNIGIFIEDHYYSKEDASVVFKRIDYRTNDVKYIYHGNDGTSMPWNDTAQLDYLQEEVQEEIIKTILQVADDFPIIRFDAAMTLTKKHFQRLWFPEPGTGGDIPTRSQYGLTKHDFNHVVPEEFWKKVVDRIASEKSDTLLLAEAFWFMEGYFVKNLGMHRVYNSAFMHMFKDEDNAKYRKVIKETLQFNPQILKRFVNFMNNPDEETAIAQFGDGDKYFGVFTVMITLPGLPMIGHGQVEGFREKYGMEYRRAYYDEVDNQDLINRHNWQIFPLINKRYLFSEVEHFKIYDFQTDNGVNENVFCYSNQFHDEKSLVFYNNNYQETYGRINYSNAGSIQDLLDVHNSSNHFIIYKSNITQKFYLKKIQEIIEQGWHIHLNGYASVVFYEFNIVQDKNFTLLERLANSTQDSGFENLEIALRQFQIENLNHILRNQFNDYYLKFKLIISDDKDKKDIKKTNVESENILGNLLEIFQTHINEFFNKNYSILEHKITEKIWMKILNSINYKKQFLSIFKDEFKVKEFSSLLFIISFLYFYSKIDNKFKILYLQKELTDFLLDLDYNISKDKLSEYFIFFDKIQNYYQEIQNTKTEYSNKTFLYDFNEIFTNPFNKELYKIHYYNGNFWFNKEQFIKFCIVFLINNSVKSKKHTEEKIELIKNIIEEANKNSYDFEKFLFFFVKYLDNFSKS